MRHKIERHPRGLCPRPSLVSFQHADVLRQLHSCMPRNPATPKILSRQAPPLHTGPALRHTSEHLSMCFSAHMQKHTSKRFTATWAHAPPSDIEHSQAHSFAVHLIRGKHNYLTSRSHACNNYSPAPLHQAPCGDQGTWQRNSNLGALGILDTHERQGSHLHAQGFMVASSLTIVQHRMVESDHDARPGGANRQHQCQQQAQSTCPSHGSLATGPPRSVD